VRRFGRWLAERRRIAAAGSEATQERSEAMSEEHDSGDPWTTPVARRPGALFVTTDGICAVQAVHALAQLVRPYDAALWGEALRLVTHANIRTPYWIGELIDIFEEIRAALALKMAPIEQSGLAGICDFRRLASIDFVVREVEIAVRTGLAEWALEALADMEELAAQRAPTVVEDGKDEVRHVLTQDRPLCGLPAGVEDGEPVLLTAQTKESENGVSLASGESWRRAAER
jgi:hypothetical protein